MIVKSVMLFRPKSPICGLNCLLEVCQISIFIDQPNLTYLEPRQLATPHQSANILQAVSAVISSRLDGDVVCHHIGNRSRIHLKPHQEMIDSS